MWVFSLFALFSGCQDLEYGKLLAQYSGYQEPYPTPHYVLEHIDPSKGSQSWTVESSKCFKKMLNGIKQVESDLPL